MGRHTEPEYARSAEPVLIGQAVLAALAFIFGGLTTMAASTNNDVLAMIGGLGTLVTGGLNIGVGVIVRGQVVPLDDVAAYQAPGAGGIVAGPASPVPDGVPVVTSEAP